MTPYRIARPPRRELLHLRGLDLHVTRWGPPPSAADPPVLLLHGFLDTGETFQFMIDEFERDRPLAALDWRGFGRSAWAREGYWFADYYADLEALLDVLSPSAPVALIGHSMGGNIAGCYAGLRSERVRSVVSLDAVGLPPTRPVDAPAHLRRWLDAIKTPPPLKVYASERELAAVIRFRYPKFSEAQADFVAAAWSEPHGTGVKLRGDSRHMWPSPLRYQREDTEACWRQIRAPMLLLLAEDSELTAKLAAEADEEFWRSIIPQIEIKRLANAGHMLHIERPAEVARLVERFLDAH